MKRILKSIVLVVALIAVVVGCSSEPTVPPPIELMAVGADGLWLDDSGDRRVRPVIAVYWRIAFAGTPDGIRRQMEYSTVAAGIAGEIAEGRVLLYQIQYIGQDLCLVPIEIPLALVDSIVVCQRDSILWLPGS